MYVLEACLVAKYGEPRIGCTFTLFLEGAAHEHVFSLTFEEFMNSLLSEGKIAFIFSLEKCSSTGRLHLQGFFQYPKGKHVRLNPCKATFPSKYKSIHLETARHPAHVTISYCFKSDTHVAGPWTGSQPY